MNVLWFLVGYGVAAWLSHRDDIDRGLLRAEEYANYVTEDDK